MTDEGWRGPVRKAEGPGKFNAPIGRAVVDDNDFGRPDRLSPERCEGTEDERFGIVHWYDDGELSQLCSCRWLHVRSSGALLRRPSSKDPSSRDGF